MNPFELFMMFLKISSVTFGGGIAILAMARTELRKRAFPEEEMADLAALATAMPGPIATSTAWLVGRRYAGFRGAAAAVTGVVLPPFVAILALAGWVLRHQDSTALTSFFRGVLCAVAALIAMLVWQEIRRTLIGKGRWVNWIPYALVVGLILAFGLHPLAAMACGVALKCLMPERWPWIS